MAPAKAVRADDISDDSIAPRLGLAAGVALFILGTLLFAAAPGCALWLWPFWVGGY